MARRILGVALACWSGGFAVVHLAWALGWRGGVPADQPPIITRPFFLAYDLTAAALMIAAAVGALVLGFTGPRRILITVAVVLAVLALLRGVPGLIMDAFAAQPSVVGVGADVWFVTSGTAGLVLARLARRAAGGSGPILRGMTRSARDRHGER